MKVVITKDFAKRLKNKPLELGVKQLIQQIQGYASYRKIPNLKKMKGTQDLYRIRYNDYIIGVAIRGEEVILFLIIAHQKGIYKRFP